MGVSSFPCKSRYCCEKRYKYSAVPKGKNQSKMFRNVSTYTDVAFKSVSVEFTGVSIRFIQKCIVQLCALATYYKAELAAKIHIRKKNVLIL